jgi:hypothetical protein
VPLNAPAEAAVYALVAVSDKAPAALFASFGYSWRGMTAWFPCCLSARCHRSGGGHLLQVLA